MKKLIQAIVIAGIFAASLSTAVARSSNPYAYSHPQSTSTYDARPNYGGGQHTYSHGGSYLGGSGSSHIGGTYQNPATNNQYGTHQ